MAFQSRRRTKPAYRKIVTYFRTAIANGRLAPGTRLPSERDLAERHGVSLMTARRALVALNDAGLVRRRVGSGTFVLPAGAGNRSLCDPHEEFHASTCRVIAREPEWVREWWEGGVLVVEERVELPPDSGLNEIPLLDYLRIKEPYATEEIWAEEGLLRIRQTIHDRATVAAVREMFVHGRTLAHGVRR